MLRAMASTVASYRDGDFSISLVVDRKDELGDLITAHNELGAALREQRQQLVQRELLLDTVTQQSPVALLLVDSHERVVYSNLAARHLLNNGTSMNGEDFRVVLSRSPKSLTESVASGDDNLFTVSAGNEEETYHLSQRRFMLRGRPHRLLLVKRLTRELSRQEVAIWKKLIRVLSHELNNSLAPISSLANSGAELARRGDLAALPGVFTTISERATHLHEFIAGYATFARLPAPRPESVGWQSLVEALHGQVQFQVVGELPGRPGYFDKVQVEQVLINLLRNAHESGSDLSHIEISVTTHEGLQRIEIRDRGSGMSESVLTQALLPFYSTKRSGSGLGLALAREIAEAHGGHIRLANREGGGVVVSLLLPLPQGDPGH
jgi:nitrogen fixation/metabolism regulation signal transduction histidine kinase